MFQALAWRRSLLIAPRPLLKKDFKKKKLETHRLRHGVTRPLNVRPEPVAHVRRQPHVDRHEQHADPARAGDGEEVVEALEDALVVLAGSGLQHEARLLAVAEDADEVEAGVPGLVEDLGDVVLAELLDRRARGGVAGDLGGLPVEVDPGCGKNFFFFFFSGSREREREWGCCCCCCRVSF